MIPALAFVPPDQVIAAFEELQDPIPLETYPVLDNFETTYIGRQHGRGRRNPMFDIGLWNVMEQKLAQEGRTNNQAEAWHRGFQNPMSAATIQQFGSPWMF